MVEYLRKVRDCTIPKHARDVLAEVVKDTYTAEEIERAEEKLNE